MDLLIKNGTVVTAAEQYFSERVVEWDIQWKHYHHYQQSHARPDGEFLGRRGDGKFIKCKKLKFKGPEL